MSQSETPTYNLKVVVKQTGIKADTLRAWERRYGLPKPQRSAGKHRLYSGRDIAILKWLKARQQEGLSISNAADLWNSLEAGGQDPLQMPEYSEPQSFAPPIDFSAEDKLEYLRESWVSACANFDEATAEQVLSEAFALYPTEQVCLQIIFEGMNQLGQGWYQGEVAVEQEHFASELASRRLEALIAAAPPPVRPQRILLGAAPLEEHDIALQLITLFLRRQGWDVLYFGANVPLASYDSILDPEKFDLAIISAHLLHTAAQLKKVSQIARERNIPMAFGGRIFSQVPALRSRISGYYLGEAIESVPQIVEQILDGSLREQMVEEPPDSLQQAGSHFEDKLPYIELSVRTALAARMADDDVRIATTNLGRNIQAALTLGDMDLLAPELDWIHGLLANRGQPGEALKGYLTAYYQAAEEHMDQHGQPILEWLEQQLNSS